MNHLTPLFLIVASASLAFAEEHTYLSAARPFLDKHCVSCHGGERPKEGLNLEGPADSPVLPPALKQAKLLQVIGERLRSRSMPPEKKPQPSESELRAVLKWIDARLDASAGDSNPGHVMIRRLTRLDYSNTIRDLFGVEVEGIESFPSDDVGFGFDNIASVISLPPLLMERYYSSAEAVALKAIPKLLKNVSADEGQHREEIVASDVRLLNSLLPRAFRRTASESDRTRYKNLLISLLESGASNEEALKHTVAAILVSPHFLFRIEKDGVVGEDRDIDDFELATRLSYFLWNSMPDAELFELAANKQLRADNNIHRQIDRMILDPKFMTGFVRSFTGQWLQLRRLKSVRPDSKLFPDFDAKLLESFQRETELLFQTVITENLSVFDLLKSDFTFANERLAKHYGLKAIIGDKFQRVSLSESDRLGVLTHGSVLTFTSHPTRTSPVLRGKWIMETILGTPPPPPPPTVPDLNQVKVSGTVRQRIELHRNNSRCASCHNRIDPLGMAFENYDATGVWRTRDEGIEIDASGKLTTGETFTNARELIDILCTKQAPVFRLNIIRQVLKYALGRTTELHDRRTINKIVTGLMEREDCFNALIHLVADSDPFLKRRNPRKISVDVVSEGIEVSVEHLGEQLAKLVIANDEAKKDAVIEITTVRPLFRIAADAAKAISFDALGRPHSKSSASRYRINARRHAEIYLIFEEGVIAPFEYSDDYLTPVPFFAESAERTVHQVIRWDQKWNAEIQGPLNPRPGSIYSFSFDAELIGKAEAKLDVLLGSNSSPNRYVNEDSGVFTITNGKHTYMRAGRRKTGMNDAFRNWMTVVASARKDAVVSNLTPIRFIRPTLGLDGLANIDFGKLKRGEASAASKPVRISNSQTKTVRDFKTTWPTILYGVCHITLPNEGRRYIQEFDNVGVEIVGEHSSLFELISEHASEDKRGLKLLGEDGQPGLTGGPESESEEFQARFLGHKDAGTYSATLRIVTQAGGIGKLSAGGDGEPDVGLYYSEFTLRAEVK